jgi:hypothetical protein
MSRSYGKVEQYAEEVFRRKKAGETNREILGLTKEQVKQLINDNLLQRKFEQSAPNRFWATDITYIPTKNGMLYLCVVIDLCGRMVLSWRIGTDMTASLVTDIVRDALQLEKVADGLALHSDQGSQYTSRAYFDLSLNTTFNRLCPAPVVYIITQPWKISLEPLRPNAFTGHTVQPEQRLNSLLQNMSISIIMNILT